MHFDGGGYVKAIDYYDGLYYCLVSQKFRVFRDDRGDITEWHKLTNEYADGMFVERKNTAYVSNDLETWTEIEKMPHHSDRAIWFDEKAVLLKQGEKAIVYEKEPSKYRRRFGDWFVYTEGREAIYLSNDNIYFVKVAVPGNEYFDEHETFLIDMVGEVGNNIIVKFNNVTPINLFTPAQPIYDELNRLKNAPYVVLNGSVLAFEKAPIIDSGRTLVPMRFLFEQMGAVVDWNGETQTATARLAGKSVSFGINSPLATVNGQSVEMDVAPRLIEDRTFVPLRFLSENLGCSVEWDAETNTVIIETGKN